MAGPTPGWAQLPSGRELRERDRRNARLEAAMRAGWTLRYDVARGEYFAGRELHTARTLNELLDKIEEAQ